MFGSPPPVTKRTKLGNGSDEMRTEVASSNHSPCGAVQRITPKATALMTAAWNKGARSRGSSPRHPCGRAASTVAPVGAGDVNIVIYNGTRAARVEGSMQGRLPSPRYG